MVLSSGSNEALQAAFVAWGRKGRIVLPSLTYTAHVHYARRMGVDVIPVPLKDDLTIDLDAMAAAVTDDVSMVYICNPNNPTGHTLDGDALRDFCRSVGRRAVVMVDEAYNELTDRPDYTSMIDLVREGENVVVMRTFSKLFGMAGMRVGYGIGRWRPRKPVIPTTNSSHFLDRKYSKAVTWSWIRCARTASNRCHRKRTLCSPTSAGTVSNSSGGWPNAKS
jgi:histidinol-phosphate/aromatic aminotransferase/cobyric acid decarboxylase-like protein